MPRNSLKGNRVDLIDAIAEEHLAETKSRLEVISAARSESERVASILALPCVDRGLVFLVSDDRQMVLATRPNGVTAPIAFSTRADYVNSYTPAEAESAADLYNSLRPSWEHVQPLHWRECYETYREGMVSLAVALEDVS